MGSAQTRDYPVLAEPYQNSPICMQPVSICDVWGSPPPWSRLDIIILTGVYNATPYGVVRRGMQGDDAR